MNYYPLIGERSALTADITSHGPTNQGVFSKSDGARNAAMDLNGRMKPTARLALPEPVWRRLKIDWSQSKSCRWSLVGLIYLGLKFLLWREFALGLAPIVIGIFFLGSVQLLFIGILGEYIGAIHTRVGKRPLVVEQERLNF